MSDEAFKSYTVTVACRGSALSSDERHLLTAMAMRAGRDGVCWASIATLEDDTGIGERTIQRSAKRLVTLGVLVVVPAPEHRTKTYRFDLSAIPRGVAVAAEGVSATGCQRDTGVRETPKGDTQTPSPVCETPSHDSRTPDPSIPSSPSIEPPTTQPPPLPLQLAPPLEDQPTVHDEHPKWSRIRGTPAVVVVDSVTRALQAIRQRPVAVHHCASDAKHVLSLQRATSTPWPELAAQLELVARWARDSDDPMASNDVRGIRATGEAWGTDRSQSVATICVQARWGDRREAARRWADGVRPTTRAPPKPRAPDDWRTVGRASTPLATDDFSWGDPLLDGTGEVG
jgi:hypothetical protein